MVKRLRYQENRRLGRRFERRDHWVLEPFDMALLAIALLAALLLPLLMAGI